MSASDSAQQAPRDSLATALQLDPQRLAEALLAATRGAPAPVVVGAHDTGHLAFLVAQLLGLLPKSARRLVIVLPDATSAALLEDGLEFFLGDAPEGAARVRTLPGMDHLPFQGMSPSRLQVLARMGTLARLASPETAPEVLILPAAVLLDRLPPPELFQRQRLVLRKGMEIDREALIAFLVATGHHRVQSVEDAGSFAVRGEILDIWPTVSDLPVRVELFGDEIDRLRTFDPISQETAATSTPVSALTIAPARDAVFEPETLPRLKSRLTALADARNVPTSRMRALITDLEHGILPVGLEELLPAFHERLETIFAHVPSGPDGYAWIVVEPHRVHETLDARRADLEARNGRAIAKSHDLTFDVDDLFLSVDETLARLGNVTRATLTPFFTAEDQSHPRFQGNAQGQRELRKSLELAIQTGESHVLTPLVDRVRRWREDGAAVVLMAHTAGGLERLRTLLAAYPLTLAVHDGGTSEASREKATALRLASFRSDPADLHLVIGSPGEGFIALDQGLVVIDESEVLSRPPRARTKHKKPASDAALKSWRDLKPGDVVVHLSHGVGRYVGLKQIAISDGPNADVLELEYADKSTMFVPVDKLHLVSKHQGGDGAPTLDKLGGLGQAAWNKTKSRVKKAVRDIADHLLKLYAEREATRGHAFSPPDELYHRFEAAFPYDETDDQMRAIDESIHDLVRERPMDRLICGDVGFGKTEVAMRAAMKVVADGKQVAVLVPTQVLAEQHRITFRRRFDGFPIQVESLSSMRSAGKNKETAAAIAAGTVDIVVGTHRLLSKDVKFKDLGLLVIDEEHRFGVAQKEHFKKARANIDVLTLTATPIPRTLHLSMLGLRDISLIQSPPVDRLPIQTFVSQPTEETISEAIRRELARGGQVFYVHHRVFDIDKQAELIQVLVPEARIAIGHGQMGDGQLEKVMVKFVTGEANVLVCTTIVESGIDIPNANTILINRADVFGLAQLYQLRGRVGRSGTRAYCYLLVPSPHGLAGEAAERLGAIQRFSELGSGYSVASYDLDIRGAGDLLGADQAGNIDAVGYDAYMDLLSQAIGEIRAHQSNTPVATEADVEIKIPVDARIPDDWLPETALRLRLYRAFAGAKTHDELAAALGIAVDRYGPPPISVKNLAGIMAVKLDAKALRLTSVSLGKDRLVLGLSGDGLLQPAIVAAYATLHPGTKANKFEAATGVKLTPDGKLHLPFGSTAPAPRAAPGPEYVRESLRQLTEFASSFGRTAPRAPSAAPGSTPEPSPAQRGGHATHDPTHAPPPAGHAPGQRAPGLRQDGAGAGRDVPRGARPPNAPGPQRPGRRIFDPRRTR